MEITLLEAFQILQAVSIIFGIAGFFYQYRKDVRERGYSTYIQTVIREIELEKMFIEHPEMQSIWEYDEKYKGLQKERRKIHHYCSMLQSLFEIALIASPLDRGWMNEEEWDGWEQLIKELVRESEDFRLAWELNKDFYCKKYRDYMEGILKLLHPEAVEKRAS